MSEASELWVTSKDLTGAPGLPASLSTIIRRSAREGWVRRPREKSKSTRGVEI
ncbi:hypothetical protein FD733_02165 [Pantoea sp. Eser]|nr:hypothetical protein [Pantoea sp. Eser]